MRSSANLARVEDLIRDAHREHGADVIVVPEGFTIANVYAKVMPRTARPVDGQPLQLLTRLARELDCVLAGGFVAVRGEHTYGTFVLAEPDGSLHLHDKDIPTAWEQHFYRGGDDAGVVAAAARSAATVGLMSGWEWARYRTAARVRARGARARARRHVLAVDATELGRAAVRRGSRANTRSGAARRASCRDRWRASPACPSPMPPTSGRCAGETPLGPGLPGGREMLGESQICDRDGTILARLSLEDGEGHAAPTSSSARRGRSTRSGIASGSPR